MRELWNRHTHTQKIHIHNNRSLHFVKNGYAAVVSYAIENVRKILSEEGKLFSGVRDQVEEMQNELKRMQCFLKDAERKKGESDSVRNWVSEIREVAYDVEDLIEHFVLKSALRNREGVMNVIKKYASCINYGVELHQMGTRIERIKSNLSSLRDSRQTYGITRELGVVPVISMRKRQDYAHITALNVVGLDEKVTELVLHLLDKEEEASVVCVYGMGGLGKTTTAKQVYNDHRVRGHFEGFAWVYISQQFTKRQVWESILTQLSDKRKEEVEKMSNEDITSQLWHIQKEKKCLIVIDDIWRKQDWENLSAAAFPCMEEENRSKILVTSRNKDVVSHGVYRTSLDILDEITSFKLLKNTILSLGGHNHPIKESSKLDKCAEEMVIACGGLPLAIIVLGGILATKHELNEWERVGVNIRSYLSRGDPNMNDGVASVLESSFEDLPCHLKPCFLYFSQYREDEEIKRSELVQKWIGEGFVSTSMDETMEEVAEDYLNELVSRCMVQAGTIGHTGRVNKCRMHDLVRDLCISKARDEGFGQSIMLMGEESEDNDGTNLGKVNCRRLCASFVGTRFNVNESNVSSHFPQLRSICFHTGDDDEQHYGGQCRVVKLISKKIKSVRVLEVSHPHWRWIGKLRNLIHLRFLKLEVGRKATSIGFGDMRCLQTLNLASHQWVVNIPNSLWRMEQLRHLYLPYHTRCESSKQRVGNFRNLQTLVNFPPVNFDLQQNLCKFKGVRKLVIGKHIDEIDEIVGSQGILFNRLQSLSCRSIVYDKIHLEAISRASPCLYRLYCKGLINLETSSFRWPSNLTKLVIEYSELDESCFGVLAMLQSLRVLFLRIYSFTGKEMVFCENGFPQLRHLKLESLFQLEACIVQEGALPSLVCLEIEDCKKLEFVHGSKLLKEIKVMYMPYAFVQRLEQERGGGSHVPSIFFSNGDMDKYKHEQRPYSWQLGFSN